MVKVKCPFCNKDILTEESRWHYGDFVICDDCFKKKSHLLLRGEAPRA